MENGLSIVVIIISATLYHFAQKNLANGLHPWLALALVYLCSFVVCLAGALLLKGPAPVAARIASAFPTIVLLSLACVGIEAGYLYAYNNGGNVSSLFTLTSTGSCIALLLIGFVIFRDPISAKKLIGLLFAIVGVALMR